MTQSVEPADVVELFKSKFILPLLPFKINDKQCRSNIPTKKPVKISRKSLRHKNPLTIHHCHQYIIKLQLFFSTYMLIFIIFLTFEKIKSKSKTHFFIMHTHTSMKRMYSSIRSMAFYIPLTFFFKSKCSQQQRQKGTNINIRNGNGVKRNTNIIVWQLNKIKRNDTTNRYAPRFFVLQIKQKKKMQIKSHCALARHSHNFYASSFGIVLLACVFVCDNVAIVTHRSISITTADKAGKQGIRIYIW